MRVTDLDKFSLEQIWRPYQTRAGFFGNGLESPPMDLDDTLARLKADDDWARLVLNRLYEMRVTFPSYTKHPLVDFIRLYSPKADTSNPAGTGTWAQPFRNGS